MPWFYLIIAGLLEVAWAVGLKQTAGWTRLWPSIITVALCCVQSRPMMALTKWLT